MLNFSHILFRFISLILGIGTNQNFPPPLSAQEEREAFANMRIGDKAARDKIIEHNLRLVSHMIRKYYASYPSPDDLLSIGSLGLIKAVDTFRYEVGTRFATYGAKCIQNEILMFFRAQKKAGMEVSINETIDVDRDGNPLTYMDVISTEDNLAEDLDAKMQTAKMLRLVDSLLTQRERQIILLRYGLHGLRAETQREVATRLGISRSYVSRIEKAALEKLRDAMEPSGIC